MGYRSYSAGGIGVGTVLAIVLSWTANHSILWAIIHGFLSWIYVIYYALIKYKVIAPLWKQFIFKQLKNYYLSFV